ncbi:hypothetical protein Q3G72_010115 [Acer saccharum]|nr:hypothetical protein Q3G72_010115 [Acer saccharum]
MHFPSSQISPNSNEECELEDTFINNGVHVNNIEDIDELELPSGLRVAKAKGFDNLEVNLVVVVPSSLHIVAIVTARHCRRRSTSVSSLHGVVAPPPGLVAVDAARHRPPQDELG